MWPLLTALIVATVPLPPETPIPCLVCAAVHPVELTFSGTVKNAQPGRLEVFDLKSHQTMSFPIPPGFHGVESSDGSIAGAPVTRAKPGLLAQVTYRATPGSTAVIKVVLLTINQCRELKAAEKLSNTPSDCPD